MMQAMHYRHSGKAPPGGLLMGAGAGLAVGLVLAFVYAYAIAYIPVVGYVTFVLAAGYGAAVGAITALVLRRGRVRNTPVSAAVGLLATLASYWVSWAVWVAAMLGRNNVDVGLDELVTDPARLLELIGRINEVGAWTLRGHTPTGTVLWVLWGLEALLVLGAGVLVAGAVGSGSPFCEGCGQWCKDLGCVLTLPAVDSGELGRRLEHRDFASVVGLGLVPPGATEWHELKLHVCERCGATNTLTVDRVTRTQNSKGETQDERKTVVDMLLLHAPEAAGFVQHGRAAAAAAQAA